MEIYMGNKFDIEKMPFVSELQNLKQICRPLEMLGITDFIFMRIYPDGTFIDLGTHVPWAKLFFENLYTLKYEKKDMQTHAFRDGIALWDNNPTNQIWHDGKLFSVSNGLSIAKPTNEYDDLYCFYTVSCNNILNDFYINHLDVLEQFINYFNDKAELLIKRVSKNKLILPEEYTKKAVIKTTDTPAIIENFLMEIGKHKSLSNNPYGLTFKELECLTWLCAGKSAAETGLILNRSKRTIETHINNMKIKLNCHKISSLIYTATAHGLVPNKESKN